VTADLFLAPYMSTARTRATFAVLAVAIASFAILQNLLFPVLTPLQEQLHTSQNAASWVFNAYLLSASVFTPIMGRIGDVVGKRRMFVVTMLALAVGSLLGALAPNIGVMITARVIQGLGGGTLPLAFGIIRDTGPRGQVTTAVGRLASVAAVSGGSALLIAGPILDSLGFRWLFWIPLIVTLAVAVAAQLVIPDSPPGGGGRISVLPPVLLSITLVTLLLGLTEGPLWGWASPRILTLQLAAVVVGALWVRSELQARAPFIDMALMRLRIVWTTNVVSFVVGVALYGGSAFIPAFVQTPSSAGYGFSASVSYSGVLVAPNSVAAFVLGLVVGRFAVAVGAKALVVIGCVVGALAMGTFAFLNASVVEICVASGLLGIGLGLCFAATASLVVHAVPAEQTSVASGINANIRTIGGAVGTGIMATVLGASAHGSGRPTLNGFVFGFAILGAAMLGGAIVALFIPDVRPEHVP
jgi:EmrB/QacA subfamily drug resistance transporter